MRERLEAKARPCSSQAGETAAEERRKERADSPQVMQMSWGPQGDVVGVQTGLPARVTWEATAGAAAWNSLQQHETQAGAAATMPICPPGALSCRDMGGGPCCAARAPGMSPEPPLPRVASLRPQCPAGSCAASWRWLAGHSSPEPLPLAPSGPLGSHKPPVASLVSPRHADRAHHRGPVALEAGAPFHRSRLTEWRLLAVMVNRSPSP